MANLLRMNKVLGLALAVGLAAHAAAPVPRPAPELKAEEPNGTSLTVSPIKGKVVVIQFLYTWCPHCQATAKWLSQMQAELGPKGLQVYGVAFNDEVNTKDAGKNKSATAQFSEYAKFPVGRSSKEPVLKYLGLSVMDGFGVPQMVVIDKKGVIQAQTKPRPAAGDLVEESITRALVTKLLNEK